MRKKKNAGKSGSDLSPLDDDHVLELAEEVLGSSDDEIIILDDESDASKDSSEDIIDLTDINDVPLGDDEDILDLTDELEEASEEDTDIMDLEDVAGQSADADDEIMELEEAIEAFTDSDTDEDIMTLEEVVDASDDTDDDIIDLEEAATEGAGADLGDIPDTKEFSIETDTIELSETDRKALEEEFGLEPKEDAPDDMGVMAETETSDGLTEIEAEPPESTLEDTLELADFPKAAEETSAGAEDEEILELTDEDRASLEAALSTDDADDSEVTTDDEPTPDLMMPAEENASEFPVIQADDTVDSEQFVEAGTEDDILELSTGDTDLTDDRPVVASDEIESGARTQTDTAEVRPVEDEIGFDYQESKAGEVDEFGEVTVEPPAETVADFAEDTPQPVEAELTLDIDDDRPTQETAPRGPEPETAQAEDEIRLDFQDDADAELSTDAVLEVTDEDESLEMSTLTEEDEHGIESVTETKAETLTPTEEPAEAESQIETAPEPSLEVDTGVPQSQDSQALAEDLGLSLEEEQPSEAVESPADEAEGDRAAETLSAQNLFDEEVADESLAEKEDDFIESLGMTIETEMEAPVAAGMTAETQAPGQDPTLGVDFDDTDAAGPVDLHKAADPISIQVKEHAEDNHTNEDELLSKVFQPETETATTPDNLEQTVERLVNKMFAEKIEAILVNAIERAVSKEIDRLKGVLLGELNRTD